MPKVVLTFDDRVLQEAFVGPRPVKIGRLPDNAVVIDNPAVSGHHARILKEGADIVLEDLQSTNGTFVNEKPITRHVLRHGDSILIGKHTLVFDQLAGDGPVAVEAVESVPELGGTVMLDTRHHRDMMAKLGREPAAITPAGPAPRMDTGPAPRMDTTPLTPRTSTATPAAMPTEPKTSKTPGGTQGLLHVLAGRADQPEYTLSAHTSLIGKSDTALVRLKGWFKPKVAVAIARKGDGYSATAVRGKTTINGQPLKARHDLKDGDVLEVSGLTLEFRLKS